MLYPEVLSYLYDQLPMFHRIGAAAYKADLNNTNALAQRLGNPQETFPAIHIAGTNGKGSVAHMLASVFQQAGYKTGLCTSPHLKDFRERFKINGQMMPREFVTDFVNQHKAFFDSLKPSFFEMTIAMTFDYFSKEKVDMAIIETGLGGRLDSTNIITPELSVITNIGFDHMNLLGNTLEAIAGEKAGIIKPGVPVVIGKIREQIRDVFVQKARENSSMIVFSADQYKIHHNSKESTSSGLRVRVEGEGRVRDITCSLTGSYQLENIVTVVAAFDNLVKGGKHKLKEEHLLSGIQNVVSNTGIMGRWQTLSYDPLTICDTGHNADGLHYVMENINSIPYSHLHFVLGVMNDKDLDQMLALLPKDNTTYYFCRPDVPRGLDSKVLRNAAGVKGLVGNDFPTVGDALKAAREAAGKDDLVFAGGSTFVVAEIV
jgi:dihydrofolate synthase / folylpolyglutamate synthase